MFALDDLTVPIIAAPMAGGPSTPELVAAVASAGGSGFLATGYKSVDVLADEIARLRLMSSAPFGVNLFVPAPDVRRDADTISLLAAYRDAIEQDAARYGVEIPEPDPLDRDGWEAKIAWLIEHPVSFVSFTFGCPDSATISRLQEAGSSVVVTVTDEDEARTAAERGANILCVQGPNAGGHRGTFSVSKSPDTRSLEDLLRAVGAVVDVPMMAAGGITQSAHVSAALDAGAVAVQLGTLLLRTPESGASRLHKDALASSEFSETRATRAFSGRWARGLVNRFLAEHHDAAPAAYPEVNQIMRPIRAAAAEDADTGGMALWSGTGYRDAIPEPAAAVVTSLWQGVAHSRSCKGGSSEASPPPSF